MIIKDNTTIPESILGVTTEHLDPVSWDWISRMISDNFKKIFTDQVFLITGGASGIGEKLSVLAAEMGASVYTVDISDEIADKFDSDKIKGIRADLSDYNNVKTIVENIGNEAGITKVVLNAGIFPARRPVPTEFCMSEFEKVMQINTFGNINLCDASLKYLCSPENKDKDPFVAIVGSRNLAIPSHPSYTMAKAAMAQYGYFLSNYSISPEKTPVRVYIEHPDAIFDTNVWGKTPKEREETLKLSAAKKGLTLEEYIDHSNPMHMQFTSWIVACSILDMALPTNRGKQGASVHHNGGVWIPKPY